MKNEYTETGRKKQKQKTRNKILSSAQKMLSSGQDFSLEDVAESSGVSRATVYRYYSNAEVLAREAGLDLHTKNPAVIMRTLEGCSTTERLLKIQHYFNKLALDNEAAFRKYLSLAIVPTTKKTPRGARRVKTLQMALDENNWNLSKEDKKRFIVIATALMGIESLVVTKDVCGLDNETSSQTLKWGMEILIKGLSAAKQDQ